MSSPSDPIGNDQREAVPRLQIALTELYGGPAEAAQSLDAAMRQAIRDRFAEAAQRRRHRLPWRVLPWAGAAAALLAIAAWLTTPYRMHQAPPTIVHEAPRGDFDRNGRLDILDAYHLARQLADAAATIDAAFDLNGDGVVNDADVNAVAMQAVALDAPRSDGATS